MDALVALAGPGGVHERTLLLVFGDHGQTMGGDHGGGSPEEVDSALLAVQVGALHAARAGRALHGSRSSLSRGTVKVSRAERTPAMPQASVRTRAFIHVDEFQPVPHFETSRKLHFDGRLNQ